MNATRQQITELIGQGLSNAAIAEQLHCDRHRVAAIRRDLGVPNAAQQPLTLEQKWAARTRPTGDGHLDWTGERQTTSGSPVMRYKERYYSPAAVAFRIRTGRDPVGYVYAECGHHQCIAPEHVDDEAGRIRTREQLRYLKGGQERPEKCVHGHDQAQHGRYGPGGVSYCEACKVVRRRAAKAVA